jgi:carbamate kinase
VSRRETVLVALGGNALVKKGQEGTATEQFENLRIPARQIARLSRRFRIIVTHGNGPQVGNLLLQQECCDAGPKMPLEILVAQTQGQIGYMIESTLDAELAALGIDSQYLVSLISYVVVEENDAAFRNPSKPIGPAYSRARAEALPFPTVKTPKGYRRVVASPRPVTVVERREIRRLLDMGFIVICCGGGGIPVIREGRAFHGIDAVVDKDLTSSRLALEVGVDKFVLATDVEGVFLDYGSPHGQLLRTLTVEEGARYAGEGHFPEGSMGSKVRAAVEFIREGGSRAVITSIEAIEDAVEGRAGTEIVRDHSPTDSARSGTP